MQREKLERSGPPKKFLTIKGGLNHVEEEGTERFYID
jgi:hypothetical protein